MGNQMQCFHQGAQIWETTMSRVLFLNTLTRQIWEDLFLKAIKIICSVRQNLTKWSKNIKLDLSIIVSVSFSNKLLLKDRNYRTHNTDMLNLDENKVVYKKNDLWRRRSFRDTQIRSMHKMGEMKRAQELRVDEVSVQKLRENHETIQKLTSQLRDMQDQRNFINDSREFQDVESNYSGRLSYVSSQPAMIPSSRSMLSRDKRLPLDTWNTSGLQENCFLVINFLRLIHTGHHQGIDSCAPQRERGSVQQTTASGTPFTRDDKQNRGTIPMPAFAGRPSTMSSLILVELPQNSMVGPQRQQIIGAAIRQIP